MSATDTPAQLEPDHAADTAGDRLRRAREHLELSLREVASELNLMVSHVRSMETNRCEHLTNDKIFLRHMRSYATRVAIDADELVELYRAQSAASEATTEALPTKRFSILNRYDSKWYAVGVLALACVGLGIWSLNQASSVTTKDGAAKSIDKTARNNPASAPETASEDLVEVSAANTANADQAVSTIDAEGETPTVKNHENAKPTKRTSAPPAVSTLARSDQNAPASARNSSRETSGNNAQYKNALRALGARPLRKTLIELTSDAAEQNKS